MDELRIRIMKITIIVIYLLILSILLNVTFTFGWIVPQHTNQNTNHNTNQNKRFLVMKRPSISNSKILPITPNIICIEPDDCQSYEWKLESIVKILENGGVGVIPTDSCYSFVTLVNSKLGVSRLLDLKGYHGQKKPLSILCKDYSTISKYTSSLTDEKWAYKLIRSILPGPYTLIIPASSEVPKIAVEGNKAIKQWKRKEIGVRMPDDIICMSLLKELSVPLLAGSVPQAAEDVLGIIDDLSRESSNDDDDDDDDRTMMESMLLLNEKFASIANYIEDLSICDWIRKVDFIIDNGRRGGGELNTLSTVIDLTSGQPVILRQGKGEFHMNNYIK